jgi:hypothetical protein
MYEANNPGQNPNEGAHRDYSNSVKPPGFRFLRPDEKKKPSLEDFLNALKGAGNIKNVNVNITRRYMSRHQPEKKPLYIRLEYQERVLPQGNYSFGY